MPHLVLGDFRWRLSIFYWLVGPSFGLERRLFCVHGSHMDIWQIILFCCYPPHLSGLFQHIVAGLVKMDHRPIS